MNHVFKEKAAESVNTPAKMLARLKEAKSVLKTEHLKKFKDAVFLPPNILRSSDGTLELKWENNGHTTRGSVSLWEVGIKRSC